MGIATDAKRANAPLKSSIEAGLISVIAHRLGHSSDYQPNICSRGSKRSSRRGFFTFLQSSIFLNSISVFLLSAGFSLMIMNQPTFYLLLSPLRIFGITAAIVILVQILLIRWWFAPATLVLLFGVLWIYLHSVDLFDESIAHWSNFVSWLINSGELLAEDNGAFNRQGTEMLLLSHVLIGAITLITFILTRLSIWFPILAYCVTIFLSYNITFEQFTLSIVVFMIGLIILLPWSFDRCARKKTANSDVTVSMQVITIPIAFTTVLMSLIITPRTGSYSRVQFLANILSDVRSIIWTLPNDAIPSFNIQSLGFGVSPDRLGGPVVLSDGYVLTVVANEPVLLRGSVLDHYTGYRWLPRENDALLRLNSQLWREQRIKAFNLDAPSGGAEAQKIFDSITSDVTIVITYASEYFSTIFSSVGMREVSFTNIDLNNDIHFNERSELHVLSPIPTGEIVTIDARVFDKDAPSFGENILLLEVLTENDPHFEEIFARYTLLPEDLPNIVRETALEVVGSETSPFLKANALAQWLGENFHYTLNPIIPPYDLDFVAHFLETREGYCTYYATAMAVMARTVGLPSRYIMGFALVSDVSRHNLFYATGSSAHAWAEIYFYGIGWIPFDPLMWNNNMPSHIPTGLSYDQNTMFEGDWGDYWSLVFASYIDSEDSLYTESEESSIVRSNVNVIVAGFVVFLLASALILYLLLNTSYQKYSAKKVKRKYPNLTDRFNFYYSNIMKQLKIIDMGIEPGETLIVYNQRIEASSQIDVTPLHKISLTQMQLHFANIPPNDESIKIAETYYEFLNERLHEKYSALSYSWHKITRFRKRKN